MDNLLVFNKRSLPEFKDDFDSKKKFGSVYFYEKCFYVKKGLKWYYFPISKVKSVQMLKSSRQLRQCCGAPIYETKSLLLTTDEDEHIYLDVEEIENGDAKNTEKLLEFIKNKQLLVKIDTL